jgi:hypothetical protein
MTKAPRSKRTKNVLPPTTQAAVEVLQRHSAELQRTGMVTDFASKAQDATFADFAPGIFEALSLPGVAREVKRIADKLGTTVDVYIHGAIAEAYHRDGYPLPPDLREYLMKQDMPPALRERFLKPHLS